MMMTRMTKMIVMARMIMIRMTIVMTTMTVMTRVTMIKMTIVMIMMTIMTQMTVIAMIRMTIVMTIATSPYVPPSCTLLASVQPLPDTHSHPTAPFLR